MEEMTPGVKPGSGAYLMCYFSQDPSLSGPQSHHLRQKSLYLILDSFPSPPYIPTLYGSVVCDPLKVIKLPRLKSQTIMNE